MRVAVGLAEAGMDTAVVSKLVSDFPEKSSKGNLESFVLDLGSVCSEGGRKESTPT